MRIGGHTENRSWFFSVLYYLLIQDSFMNSLKQHKEHDGCLLLFKILTSLKVSILDGENCALDMIMYFVEALLQGHLCYYEFSSFSPSTAWSILRRMASPVFDKISVEFKKSVKCDRLRPHDDSYLLEFCECKTDILVVPHLSLINDEGMILLKDRNHGVICDVCDHTSTTYSIDVLSPQSPGFLTFFPHGVSQEIWNNLEGGNLIRIGEHFRTCSGAIFEIGDHEYVTCILMSTWCNNGKKYLWRQFSTSNKNIMQISKTAATRKKCRYVFFGPPEKSCFCNEYDIEPMHQCSRCDQWIHFECCGGETSQRINANPDLCQHCFPRICYECGKNQCEIQCRECDNWSHLDCVGITDCSFCNPNQCFCEEDNEQEDLIECQLCGCWVHLSCVRGIRFANGEPNNLEPMGNQIAGCGYCM